MRWHGADHPDEESEKQGSAADHQMGVSLLSTMLAGPIMFGAIAWLLGRWWGVPWLPAVGIVAGMVLSIYIIWMRYGRQ